MAILILNHERGFNSKTNKPTHLRSLVECEICLTKRSIETKQARKKATHICGLCSILLIRKNPERKYLEEDYHKIAQDKGIIWTGNSLPKHMGKLTSWRCPNCNYEWEGRLQTIKELSMGCRQCNGKKRKITQDYYDKLSNKFNIIRIGHIPINSHNKIEWKLPCGHLALYSYQQLNLLLSPPTCEICFPAIEKSIYEKCYSTWSKRIKDKFDKKCQKCGSTSNLESHHIRNRRDNPNLILDENNGICLCETCHNSFHHIFGRRDTNQYQLLEFLKIK